MSLNIEKLENVSNRNGAFIARCPACAETGHDNKGNHLYIDEQARYSCVKYPGEIGKEHRKRIFALVGVKDGNEGLERHNKVIKVKRVTLGPKKVIKKDILGRLGRVNLTYARKEKNNIKKDIIKRNFEKGVPPVPSTEVDIKQNYTKPISKEVLKQMLSKMKEILKEVVSKMNEEIQNTCVGTSKTQSIQEAISLIKEAWVNCEKGISITPDKLNELISILKKIKVKK